MQAVFRREVVTPLLLKFRLLGQTQQAVVWVS